MAKRYSLTSMLVNRGFKHRDWDIMIGHPCGAIAPASYLREHPKASRNVARYLQGDASFAGDFELMLIEMGMCGCEMPRSTWRHLKFWVSKGCPHWSGNTAFSKAMVWWWNRHAWTFVPNRNGSDQASKDAADYFVTVAYSELEQLQQARNKVETPLNPPF
jgi:hypothetical protein